MSILRRAHTLLLWAGGAYALFLAALSLEPVQRSLIYLHQIRFPFDADFDHPEQLGFSPGKVRNFYLTTEDGAVLGVWHVLPAQVYDSWVETNGLNDGSLPEKVFDEALRSYPTTLYYHGNAATRGAPNRVRVARAMSEMNQNFLIVDYRGFAESTGKPSEEGLLIDARRLFDFVALEKGAPQDQITIMGQSLGTGVSAGVTALLAKEDITPRALILVAPFSSVGALLSTYRLGNFIPILSPLRSFPWLMSAFLNLLHTRFDTSKVIHTIRCPILILHAQDDPVIPFSHSATLAKHLLAPLVPAHLLSNLTSDDPAVKAQAILEHEGLLTPGKALVDWQKVGGWGTVTRFARGKGYADVVWAEAFKGQHNDIGTSEYSMKLIRDISRS